MNIRTLQAIVLWGSVFALCQTAYAQDYVETPVGVSFPLWLEASASINDDGNVAWTHYDYGANIASARVLLNGSNEPLAVGNDANGAPLSQSYATDLAHDGAVVGWGANNNLSVREAKLWATGSYSRVDLHAQAPAGYRVSVADRIVKVDNMYYIVGWVRKQTNKNDLPEAYLWKANGSNVQGVPLHGGANVTSAFARAVAEPDRDGKIWVCGGAAATGTYAQAACWDVSQSNPNPWFFVDTQEYASSSVEKVRTLDIDGTKQTIMVGFGTDADGETRPIAYNITEGFMYDALPLVSNGTGIVKDVSLERWSDADGEHGPVFVGTMSTTPPLNISVDGPGDTLTHMRATYQTRLGDAVSDAWPVCSMNEGMSASAAPQSVTSAVSSSGRYRLSWSSADHGLTRLERKDPSLPDLQVYVRDAEVRTARNQREAYSNSAGIAPTKVQYYWAESTGSSRNGSVMWSDIAGCEPFDNGHRTDYCDPNRTFSLDGTSPNARVIDFTTVISGTTARTDLSTHGLPPVAAYVQAALQDGQCKVSSVRNARDVESINNFATASNETGRNWQDCELSPDVEYDTDVNLSFDHCGVCGNTCERANMDSWCSGGSCDFGACDPGWVDLNENPDDGCECQNLGQDDPELTTPFLDTNCDGVDGDIAKATFVATSGTDSAACGTMAAPCKTIQYGIDKTSAGNYVLVAGGTYPEAITLKNGVSVYGGYSAADWSRSTSNAVTVTGALDSGHGWAVRGTNISAETILNQITFVAPAATSAGASSVGIACTTCNGLHVAYATVQAKAGQAGTNGTAGNSGSVGMSGGTGASGNGRSAGSGGSRTCSFGTPPRGGNGGEGGGWHLTSCGSRRGSNGSAGASWSPASGGGGAGGEYKKGLTCQVGGSAKNGGNGGGGSTGTAGTNGGPGARPSISANRLTGGVGANGLNGTHGSAGGGGGGGAGNFTYTGGGGGGGGAGGCAGRLGTGGMGGGGSVGVLLQSSPSAKVANTIISTSNAGKGGNGGSGGSGAVGAGGGSGVYSGSDGRGGNGGSGGNGGRGGHGGGGAGGDSVCILTYGGTVSAGNRGGTTCTNGSAGGAGTSSGNNGPTGQTGLIVNR